MSDTSRVSSDLEPGTVLCGRYRVEEKLADGAVASVYRATDGDAVVALKVLDPLRGADPVGRQRFEREFEVLCKLQHPNISRCLDLKRDGDLDILVLEYVEGETLQARLSRGRFSVREAVQRALQLCEALQVCHAQGVLHRDLKPANVMVHPERGAVILDFGVAWFSSAANLTRTGAVVGSPQYLAPEALSSSLWDARADIYSVGVMLFEMLCGRPIHAASGVAELALMHLKGDPPRVSAIRPEVGESLANAVARAITPRPEHRFATISELARALQVDAETPGKALQARIPCRHCQTPLVIDLPFCPGCGADAAWELSAGPFAVQLDKIVDVKACAEWLATRYAPSLRIQRGLLERRLAMTPVPLVVNASAASAEQLAAEGRAAGCEVEVVRARAVLGARIKASAASLTELFAAAVLHGAAVMAVGALGVVVFRWDIQVLKFLPPLMAVLGIGVAARYVRRPILTCEGAGHGALATPFTEKLRRQLALLKTDRARRLAAAAVARAAPLLLEEPLPLRAVEREEVFVLLERAVDAAVGMDAHCQYLATRSRSKLGADMEEAQTRAALGDAQAVDRVAELSVERQGMLDAALAHDLSARVALEACAGITGVLSNTGRRLAAGKG
jgi:tRNA A-37 threonylcarbamoyl transferase component Bud32